MRSAWRGGVSAFWEYARAACLTTQAARLFVRGPGGGGGVGPEAQLHGARPLQADTCAGGGLVYKNTALSLRSRVLRDTMRHVFVMCGSKTFLRLPPSPPCIGATLGGARGRPSTRRSPPTCIETAAPVSPGPKDALAAVRNPA